MHATLVIPATFEALVALGAFIGQVVPDAPDRMRLQVTLAVHELCMNIVQHGYAGTDGDIRLEVDYTDQRVHFEIYDHGPYSYEETDVVAPDPFDLPEHGWGIPILHRVMDEVHYQRLDSGSHWTLIKAWKAQTKMMIETISIAERLDAVNAPLLRADITAAIERGVTGLILDCKLTEFIDSSGLAALVSAHKSFRARNRTMALVNIQGGAREIFDLTRMDLVFTIFPTVAQAIQSIEAKP